MDPSAGVYPCLIAAVVDGEDARAAMVKRGGIVDGEDLRLARAISNHRRGVLLRAAQHQGDAGQAGAAGVACRRGEVGPARDAAKVGAVDNRGVTLVLTVHKEASGA